jgi:hypothetical protein
MTQARNALTAPEHIKAWTDMVDAFRPLSETLSPFSAATDPALAAADTNWMLLNAIGQYITNFRDADPNFPQFTPLLNTAYNSGAPVPDYIYQIAIIDGRGTYRLTGTRGTSRFVEFGILSGFDGKRNSGDTVGRFSFDDIHVEPGGTFSALLSTERPEGYTGDWIPLDPNASTILVRHGAYDWKREIDARLAIDRIDAPDRIDRQADRDIAGDLAAMVNWAGFRVSMWHKHIAQQRETGAINVLAPVGFRGQVVGQLYLEGGFDIDEDHGLLIETEVPETCLHWSLLVTDVSYATVDWMRHQSSLNGFQARLDSDGRFRAVIAARDPGIPNWIDTAGLMEGMMQLRWNGASSEPIPAVTKVALASLRDVLPADTPIVGPAERADALRERREGAQLRRRW